jgi:hypothetical protein
MTTSGSFEAPASPVTTSAPAPSAGGSVSSSVLLTFRDTIRSISPPWLQTGNAEKIMYSFGVHMDLLGDAIAASVKLRFPGLYSVDSLPYLGRERRIRRGRYDSDSSYANRLQRWLDDHRRRGGPYAMLEQIHAHFAPNNFPVELVYASGRRFSMDVDGNIVMDDIVWTPPGPVDTLKWARWWLFYHWPTPVYGDGLWGDPGTWGDGGVWGSSLSPADVQDLRLVPREWNAAHAIGRIVLISPVETVSIGVE